MAAGSVALGFDAGGTATGWQVLDGEGRPLAAGRVPGFSATMLGGARQGSFDAALAALRLAVAPFGRVGQAVGGLTGHEGSLAGPAGALHAAVAGALGVPPDRLRLCSDVELAFRGVFVPGTGVLLMAGTGSIAAHVDVDGALQRAGGRGHLLDDAGSGYWIAREALRAVWRAEDDRPGAWRDSALARALFAALGGPDWPRTRQFIGTASRGEVGALATAVAGAARDGDPFALALLRQAGAELARVASALLRRLPGPQPLALAGRVFELDPGIERALRDALSPGTPVRRCAADAALAAARLALGIDPRAAPDERP